MAESLQQSIRRQLLSAAAAGSAAFETSGVLSLPKPLSVFFKDHNNQPGCVTFPLPGNDPTELQPLLDACSPAQFGLGRQTLHDPSVRRALALPAERLGLGLAPELPGECIMRELGDLMLPESDWPAVRAEPYALNVYSPDGFFKAHRDTPASPDMFGSLILCLPTEFSGGQLVIRSPDLSTSVTHDWGATSSDRLAAGEGGGAGSIAWAAMFSDCEHEIRPVTTGHRVTLTYNLFNDSQSDSDSEAAPSPLPSTARESAFGTQLGAALADATWYPAGVTLGLVLEHFYAVEVEEEDSDHQDMPDSIEPQQLKGSDLQLYRAAAAHGLQVRILPVVSGEKYKDEGDLVSHVKCESDGSQDYPRRVGSTSPLSTSKLAVMQSFQDDPTSGWEFQHGGREGTTNPLSWAEFLQRRVAKRCAAQINGELLWVKPPGRQHLKYWNPCNHYEGNSCYQSSYYAAAALLVEVPAAGASQRQEG